MKKYLAAGAVAVIVFAISAFAASLNVDGGVLQAGVDDDLTCTENVALTYDTGYNHSDPTTQPFQIRSITATVDEDHTCGEDVRVHIKVGTSDAHPGNPSGYAIGPLDENGQFTAYLEEDEDGFSLLVEDLNQIQVMLKGPSYSSGEADGYFSGVFLDPDA